VNEKQMRIGINAIFLNEKPTGVGVFTREVSARLCDLNKDTIVFTSASIDIIQGQNIIGTPAAIRGSMRLSNNLKRLIYCNTILPVMLKRYRVDILYCPIMEFPFIPLSPLIVTLHDLHPLYFPEQFGLSAGYFKSSLRLLPRLARRVIVPSRFVKEELLNVLDIDGERIDIVPLGCDSTIFKPQGNEMRQVFLKDYAIKGPFILFVGSLFPYKNVNTLLRAFLDIKDRIPHQLIIIGRKDLSPEPLYEDERVRYLDYVGLEDIVRFYSFADLLIHPSLREGFGMTILEAMACGTPVLSSNRGSLPEVVGEAGILFDPEDSKALAELILKVLNNERLRKEMIEKGLEHVKRFSWQKTAEGILKSCERALME
jgi:glycosyltransferase involved in cell wall biosynthesis